MKLRLLPRLSAAWDEEEEEENDDATSGEA